MAMDIYTRTKYMVSGHPGRLLRAANAVTRLRVRTLRVFRLYTMYVVYLERGET